MFAAWSICLLLISGALGSPRSLSRHERDPAFDVNVSSERTADCGYEITFTRADSTETSELELRYDIEDIGATQPVDEGVAMLQDGQVSVSVVWNPPSGWVAPYHVHGVTMVEDPLNPNTGLIVGEIISYIIPFDGPCTPGSAKRDPHMRTFDGYPYGFHGICWYTLVKHCTTNPEFEITAKFEPRDTESPELKTRAVAINITVGDERISMDKNTILVNDVPYWVAHLSGRPRNAKIGVDSGKVSIGIKQLKLEIMWDGRKHIFNAAILNPEYRGHLCGLLGNADENPHNDLQKRDGRFTKDVKEFGESWKVPNVRCNF